MGNSIRLYLKKAKSFEGDSAIELEIIWKLNLFTYVFLFFFFFFLASRMKMSGCEHFNVERGLEMTRVPLAEDQFSKFLSKIYEK